MKKIADNKQETRSKGHKHTSCIRKIVREKLIGCSLTFLFNLNLRHRNNFLPGWLYYDSLILFKITSFNKKNGQKYTKIDEKNENVSFFIIIFA